MKSYKLFMKQPHKKVSATKKVENKVEEVVEVKEPEVVNEEPVVEKPKAQPKKTTKKTTTKKTTKKDGDK